MTQRSGDPSQTEKAPSDMRIMNIGVRGRINPVTENFGCRESLLRCHCDLLLNVPLIRFLEPFCLMADSFHTPIMPRKQVAGKSVGGVVFHARTRFGHHAGHRVTPGGVVGGRLVRGGCFDAPVNLNEQEPGGVILLLQ